MTVAGKLSLHLITRNSTLVAVVDNLDLLSSNKAALWRDRWRRVWWLATRDHTPSKAIFRATCVAQERHARSAWVRALISLPHGRPRTVLQIFNMTTTSWKTVTMSCQNALALLSVRLVESDARNTYFITQTWLRYVRIFAIANSSVVCNVRAPYSGGWNFRQYFSPFCTLAIFWPPCKILRRCHREPVSWGR